MDAESCLQKKISTKNLSPADAVEKITVENKNNKSNKNSGTVNEDVEPKHSKVLKMKKEEEESSKNIVQQKHDSSNKMEIEIENTQVLDTAKTETDKTNSLGKQQKVEIVQASPTTADNNNLSPQITATAPSQTTPAVTPENLLSPPKSETLTDETNTMSSSSPASTSQLSPIGSQDAASSSSSPRNAEKGPQPTALKSKSNRNISKPINVVANGTIPKSGKPLVSTMNKKLNKPTRTRKPKTMVAMYESEISDHKIGIKLCIKKSDASVSTVTVLPTNLTASKATATATASAPAVKQIRKRSRKSKTKTRLDSDDSEHETKRKKGGTQQNSNERQKKVSFAPEEPREPVEQTKWGAYLPREILHKIFQIVVDKEGCLPTLCRLARVCSQWRRVSLSPKLWHSLDLSTYVKEKYRTELKLKWFVDHRMYQCADLNVSNWKMSDINCFLHKLAKGAPNLMGITLSGWKTFTCDHLAFLVDNMKKLERIDLSSVNVEMNASKSAVGLQSLCNALQKMNGRLTHLYLAHNRLAGIPQIVNILSTHCPNLMLLDLSNVTTQATSHGVLHIEKLQHGCQKLKVLRVTNSHVTFSTVSMQEMMDSPGFPDLEELSVAALTDESRLVGDEHVQRILKNSSKLKLLDVRGCTRLTHESLIRLPAWDIKHLFLSGCSVTRDMGSGLELIASKWAHSLIELDLAWANVQQPLDNALRALAEKGSESPLAHLNLCGSSVSEEAVKEILANCAQMSSINLSSCRGLPRGVKRLMQGPQELLELREVLKVQMKVKLPIQVKNESEQGNATTGTDGDGNESSTTN